MGDKLKADRARIAELEAIYRQLPRVACVGRCAIACGPLILTTLEARRLHVSTHVKPRTDEAGKRCIYLTPAGRCAAYAIRPLICRVYGVLEMLSCPHGCQPDRWIGELEMLEIFRRVERLGGGNGRTAPDGFTPDPSASFFDVAPESHRRTPEQVARTSARTRGLRALHGGRIIIALHEDD